MKKIILIGLLLSFVIQANSQFRTPVEVVQKLGNDRSFSRYANEMMKFVKEKQDAFRSDPEKLNYYERQEKYLARNLMYLEGRQDRNGNIFNYVEKTWSEAARYNTQQQPNGVESAYGSWSLIGPTNNVTSSTSNARGQGRVDRFAFHPSDPDIVYAGTPCAGLWRSNDGGLTWNIVSNSISNQAVSGVVVSWADPNDLYILTGDGDSNLGDGGFVQGFDYIRPSIGVLKSTDGGTTWTRTGSFGLTGFYVGFKLIQSPTSSGTLIAATSQGMYRTTNSGASWTLVSPDTQAYYDIEWKPGSSTRVYAGSDNNFFISNDGGASFVNQDNNFDIAIGTCSRIAIAVTPANSNYVYVFAGLNGSPDVNKGVYRSTNSGDNFTRRSNSNSLVSTPSYMHNIAVSPTNVNTIIVGSLEVFRSTDGGANFSQINQRSDASLTNYTHADVHDVIFSELDGDLYLGTDGGAHKSFDNGTNIQFGYSGFSNTQVYHFDVSELSTNHIFFGAQDNGLNRRTSVTSIFNHVTNGDGYSCKFEHGSTGPGYFGINQKVYKSNADFTSFAETATISPDNWYQTIAISYFNNNTVFTSGDDIYLTTNGGTSWTNKFGSGRWAMITCPSNSNRVYAAGGASWNDGGAQTSKLLMRSDDLGDTWTTLSENANFPETITKVTGIAVDPNNSNRVWVTMGGFTEGEKVFYSNNAGASWANLSGTLPNVPVNCVAIDENLDAYIGTDIGVFYKSSTMNDWQPFTNNLPRIPVTELHIWGTTIYASTFGRGIWSSPTHTACVGALSFLGTHIGYRYYEALSISSAAVVGGGEGTEVYYKAQDGVTLNPGFQANGSINIKFRAWIGNCGTGGVPDLTVNNGTGNKLEVKDQVQFTMPFDAKASLLVLDDKGAISNRLAENEVFRKGKIKRSFSGLEKMKGTLCLIVDGQLVGTMKL